jgi:hypothetical protein
VIFIFEMMIKMIGFGLKNYFRDKMNNFDCVIVVLSFIDLILSNVSKSTNIS